MKKLSTIAFLGLGFLGAFVSNAQSLKITKVSTYFTGDFDESATEIVAYDKASKRLFYTNAKDKTVDVLDISTPESPSKIKSIALTTWGKSANSVASYGGYIAIAVEDTNKQANGKVVIIKADDESYVTHYSVGALPDMVTFSHDGNHILVACEGEPSDDYTVDPEGTIGVIDVSGGISQGVVSMINFNQYDNKRDSLRNEGVRIFGNNGTASVSQDLEPEYIAVSPDNKTAYVTLQENNAIAIVDIASKTLKGIKAFELVDHSLANNGFDASDKDGIINIKPQPTFGLALPDAVSSYEVGGKTYFVTANEGDTRDYGGYSEEEKVGKLNLDTVVFPNYADLQKDENLGRLLTTTSLGDTDNDGDIDKIYSIGTRSFSIWDSTGNLVFDSGDQFERKIAAEFPLNFNTSNSKNDFDDRSDAKGCEPEALTIAEIEGKFYAFIGLERMGGIMVYDITNPTSPVFDSYEVNRDYNADVTTNAALDLGPEGLLYIKPSDVPVDGIASKGLLVCASEVSGTVTIFALGTYSPTSVNSIASEVFSAYPNPITSGLLSLSAQGNYTLLDVVGNTIQQFSGSSINVEQLSQGVYFVRNEFGKSVRFIKQ